MPVRKPSMIFVGLRTHAGRDAASVAACLARATFSKLR
jgi:hypothetical protein